MKSPLPEMQDPESSRPISGKLSPLGKPRVKVAPSKKLGPSSRKLGQQRTPSIPKIDPELDVRGGGGKVKTRTTFPKTPNMHQSQETGLSTKGIRATPAYKGIMGSLKSRG